MESICAYLDGAEKNFWCIRDSKKESILAVAAILGLVIDVEIPAA